MDKLLFGDNQFFGVNHMSEEKARSQAMRFRSLDAIMETLDAAYEEGIYTFMCTTHDRIGAVCDVMRANPEKYAKSVFYPGMPYAHKYANAVTEDGMLGAMKRFLPDEGMLTSVFKGGMSLVRKDVEGLATMLVDAELKMFKGLKTPVIFLQNVVVDLLLGMRMYDSFRVFSDHVKRVYGAEPCYITMNLPKLLDALQSVGVENPIVCANINKIGFRMSGGVEAYQHALRTRECRAIAMSVFASGALPASEAISWISEQPNIQSIVFGASSRGNIRSTRELVDRYFLHAAV